MRMLFYILFRDTSLKGMNLRLGIISCKSSSTAFRGPQSSLLDKERKPPALLVKAMPLCALCTESRGYTKFVPFVIFYHTVPFTTTHIVLPQLAVQVLLACDNTTVRLNRSGFEKRQ